MGCGKERIVTWTSQSRDRHPEYKQQLKRMLGNERIPTEFRHFLLLTYFGMLARIKIYST